MALKARVGSRWHVRDALSRPSGDDVLRKAEHFPPRKPLSCRPAWMARRDVRGRWTHPRRRRSLASLICVNPARVCSGRQARAHQQFPMQVAR